MYKRQVLGRLADDGVHIGCEGDVDAELAQIAENYLTGLPTFITDMINICLLYTSRCV